MSTPAPICCRSSAQARDIVHQIEGFNTRYNRTILEQAAIVGALDPDAVADPAQAAEIGSRIASRLDRIADEVERGWTGEPDGQGGFVFSRTIRGVTERHEFDANLLASADARKMRQMIDKAGELFAGDRQADPQGRHDRDFRAVGRCSASSRPPAARACRCSATRASAK